MIKIIKNGKKPIKTKVIYTTTCGNCGCKFEFEDEDLISEKRINGKKVITCPYCNKQITLFNGDFGNEGNYTTREEKVKEIDQFIPYPDHDWLKGGIYPDPNYKDPCETCPNRFGPTDGLGRPIPGDSPCQWCQHYKYKITWTTNSPAIDNPNYSICDTKVTHITSLEDKKHE